jgi:hypothetical protein
VGELEKLSIRQVYPLTSLPPGLRDIRKSDTIEAALAGRGRDGRPRCRRALFAMTTAHSSVGMDSVNPLSRGRPSLPLRGGVRASFPPRAAVVVLGELLLAGMRSNELLCGGPGVLGARHKQLRECVQVRCGDVCWGGVHLPRLWLGPDSLTADQH